MVFEFIKQSDKFNAAEVRNTKAAMSSRESYGDQAIGYVCLKRDGSLGTCIIKCKVCPEHRVRNKGYSVTLIIHEKDEKVIVRYSGVAIGIRKVVLKHRDRFQ
ncbi:Uncharacterized protein DBV15_12906 [Temnothorax longispinosus]|uniref:Uncharacterized protein n=1 Tax=Temnothorax longispinosus TaxID=300112 RepID=A0A4S2K878_9HYME|nr:Uncharacterized protein DBV15_12906 [Temnothorax longispinosus]